MQGYPEHIRPMGIGELLDTGFRLWRTHVRVLFLIVLAPNLLLYGVNKAFQIGVQSALRNLPPKEILLFTAASLLPLIAVALVIHNLSMGAVAKAIETAYHGGRPEVFPAYRTAFPRFGALIWSSLVLALMISFGFLFCFFPALIIMIGCALLIPVVVMEPPKSGVAAIRRAWDLLRDTEGWPWYHYERPANKAGLLLLLTWVLQMMIGTLGSIPTFLLIAGWGIFAKGGPDTIPQVLLIPAELFNLLLQCLVAPFGMLALVLLYYDMRHRKEGFDLELLARSLADAGRPDTELQP